MITERQALLAVKALVELGVAHDDWVTCVYDLRYSDIRWCTDKYPTTKGGEVLVIDRSHLLSLPCETCEGKIEMGKPITGTWICPTCNGTGKFCNLEEK